MPARYRAYTPTGVVAHSGDVNSSGEADFDADKEVISMVVFYTGPEDDEAVCGSVVVNHSGPVLVGISE